MQHLRQAAQEAGVFELISQSLTEEEDLARQVGFLQAWSQVIDQAGLRESAVSDDKEATTSAAKVAHDALLDLVANHATYTHISLQIQRQELAPQSTETPAQARSLLLAFCEEAMTRSFPSESFFRGFAFLGACALLALLHPPEEAFARRSQLFATHTKEVGNTRICEQELQDVPLALAKAGFHEPLTLTKIHWQSAEKARQEARVLRRYLDFGNIISADCLVDLAEFYRGLL